MRDTKKNWLPARRIKSEDVTKGENWWDRQEHSC